MPRGRDGGTCHLSHGLQLWTCVTSAWMSWQSERERAAMARWLSPHVDNVPRKGVTQSNLAAFSSLMVLTMGYTSDVLLARNTTDGQVSCIAPRLVGRDHLPSPCAGSEDVCWSCRCTTRPRETTAALSPSSLPQTPPQPPFHQWLVKPTGFPG